MHPAIAIPATLALVVRAYTRKSLTLPGILAATVTAIIHALHPSPVPFTLLVVFFLLGTAATKVKHDIKATLTLSSTGSAGGEGSRTTTQVLANSGIASALILSHLLRYGTKSTNSLGGPQDSIYGILLAGIIANYAAVTSDTLSSELGILSRSKPRLITAPWQTVPPGTNGGVTFAGLAGGAAGSFIIGLVSVSLLSFHNPPRQWHLPTKLNAVLIITAWGTLGSMLDSVLGAILQASVVDKRTGKVVEGAGGTKVLVKRKDSGAGLAKSGGEHEESRALGSGRDLLDNNQVNVLMALLMSLGGMAGSAYFENILASNSLS